MRLFGRGLKGAVLLCFLSRLCVFSFFFLLFSKIPLSCFSGCAALLSLSYLIFSISPPPSNSDPALLTPFW